MVNDEFEGEQQIIHLAFVAGEWAESNTKLLGAFGHKHHAKAVAEEKEEKEDWHASYTKEVPVQELPVIQETHNI